MPRYIDADKADVEQISCFYGGECHIDDVKEWIDTQPTADVAEVVRCKDCDIPHNKWTGCPKLNGTVTDPEFFCAAGVRRKEDAYAKEKL